VRRLEHAGDGREARVVDQPPERQQAQVAVADLGVAVDAAAGRRLGVVEVERAQALDADRRANASNARS
jgi:hypothetical protein